MNLLKKSQAKQLKKVESEFYKETNVKGEEMLAQLYLDDNFFNSFFSVFTTIEKMFSARDLAKPYPASKPLLDMLTTSTIGAVMP